MRRPVWLLSLDTEEFSAPPLTTGALKAHFAARGRTATETDVELVHFATTEDVGRAPEAAWLPRMRAASAAGVRPVLGLSCYAWNTAEFLALAGRVKAAVPDVLVVAGGPHVQRAEDFLGTDPVDVIVLGEGEATFTALLDCPAPAAFAAVEGCAFLAGEGRVQRTAPRARTTHLDDLPSALDVVPLRDAAGRPLYRHAAYETSRGCPYRCAFCEWGTGAIGTKMYQFSLDRIAADLGRLAEGGIEDLWFCDSNFGALREDVAKAELVVALKRKTGSPRVFSTSWSKNHNRRVQDIVRLLHRHGLLAYYHLALQTLTPRALELAHRTNMRANDYEPVVRALAAEGVPVAGELIWGLPGDTLAEFEGNLDRLFTVFPNIYIFCYTLLPGTEFYDRREEYRLETLPIAGYGRAKGEYVVGCHTFSRDEGEEGYHLVTAHVVLFRGQLMPFAVRAAALDGRVSVSALLRAVLRAVLADLADELPAATADRMAVYEARTDVYLALLARRERTYATIRRTLAGWLAAHGAADLMPAVGRALALDEALCPRPGAAHAAVHAFDFAADRALDALSTMAPPSALLEDGGPVALHVEYPGGAGEVVRHPDGGAWMRGRVATAAPAPA